MSTGPTTNAQYLSAVTNILDLTVAWSVKFWVKLTSTTGTQNFFVIWTSPGGGNYIALWQTGGGAPQFDSDLGTTTPVGGGNMGSTNWEFFCITYDPSGAGTITVWRKIGTGAVASQLSMAPSTPFVAGSNQVIVDNDEGPVSRTRGQILSYAEWAATLTQREVENEASQIRPLRTANLNRWLPILNNAQNGLDWSGAGHSLTRTGTFTDATTMPPVGYGRSPCL
jgi:hypothetical protein